MSTPILLILIYCGCIGDARRINQDLLLKPPGTTPASRLAGMARHAMIKFPRQAAQAAVRQQSRQFASKLVKDGPTKLSKAMTPNFGAIALVLGWELDKALSSRPSKSTR